MCRQQPYFTRYAPLAVQTTSKWYSSLLKVSGSIDSVDQRILLLQFIDVSTGEECTRSFTYIHRKKSRAVKSGNKMTIIMNHLASVSGQETLHSNNCIQFYSKEEKHHPVAIKCLDASDEFRGQQSFVSYLDKFLLLVYAQLKRMDQ